MAQWPERGSIPCSGHAHYERGLDIPSLDPGPVSGAPVPRVNRRVRRTSRGVERWKVAYASV